MKRASAIVLVALVILCGDKPLAGGDTPLARGDKPLGLSLSIAQDQMPPPVATFSILGFDPATGEIGGAVQSRVFSAGNGVLWGEAGVGMVATQAIIDVSYGPKGLALLKAGGPKGSETEAFKVLPVPWTSVERICADTFTLLAPAVGGGPLTREQFTPRLLDAGKELFVEKYDQHVRRVIGILRLSGDLTIHGVTKPVTLEVEGGDRVADPWGGTRTGFSARTSISRKEFGLTWNMALETGGVLVGKTARIELAVQATGPAQAAVA